MPRGHTTISNSLKSVVTAWTARELVEVEGADANFLYFAWGNSKQPTLLGFGETLYRKLSPVGKHEAVFYSGC
jgi:hypothetical protein